MIKNISHLKAAMKLCLSLQVNRNHCRQDRGSEAAAFIYALLTLRLLP